MNGESNNRKKFPTFSRQKTIASSSIPVVKLDIEGYKIFEQIGEGGMGAVWRAIQISTNREVALKVTNAQVFGSKRALARFEREVELAARLEHPNVARVYDSGIHQKVYYYAMERIDGLPLDEYVEREQLSVRKTIGLMNTVFSAVQYAHQRGVIHRDLKSSNILVTDDGQTHILDFGLAKDLLNNQTDRTVSLDGDILGTPAYMSPEQAAGQLDQVDTRSDIYSLGVILYHLLTHNWPYDVEGTHFEVLRNIQEQEPERPSNIIKQIDRDLEAILLQSLQKEPDKRYQSVTELKEDTQNWLEGLPVRARSINSWYLLGKFIMRHRTATAIVILLAVIILSTGFIGIFSLHQVNTANIEMERLQEAYEKEKSEEQNLMNQVAFSLFLERWRDGDNRANLSLMYLSKKTREYRAVRFLLDPDPISKKLMSIGYATGDQPFWQFIIAEHLMRDGYKVEARKAYQQCIMDSKSTNDWFLKIARSRLEELR